MDSRKFIYDKMTEYHESLLESGHLSDVVLIVGAKEFRAHKVILSARSPVFAAMFAHQTKEAQENRVEIVDIDVKVVELMVRYVYTGKVGQLEQYATDLLIAADKYQLDCLKCECERQLLSEITVWSVCDLLLFADMYQVAKLANECLDYIVNNVTQRFGSVGWKAILVKPNLMSKLYERLSMKYAQVTKYDKKQKKKSAFKKKEFSDICEYATALVAALKIDSNENKQEDNRIDWIEYAILIEASDVNQLNYLLSTCEQNLLPKISTESVSDLLILADMHHVTELANKCIDYITDNGTQVMATEGWTRIVVKPDLVDKLFQRLAFECTRVCEKVDGLPMFNSY